MYRILNPLGFAGLIIGALLIFTTTKLSTRIVKNFEHELATINMGLEKIVHARTGALMKTRNAVIFGLAKLAESRDSDTGEHLERISLFSSKLANVHAEVCKELDGVCVQSIGLASSLHDIGKVGVPDRVLLKPGKLTFEERKEIETHPKIGEDCLNAIEGRLEEDGFLSLRVIYARITMKNGTVADTRTENAGGIYQSRLGSLLLPTSMMRLVPNVHIKNRCPTVRLARSSSKALARISTLTW